MSGSLGRVVWKLWLYRRRRGSKRTKRRRAIWASTTLLLRRQAEQVTERRVRPGPRRPRPSARSGIGRSPAVRGE